MTSNIHDIDSYSFKSEDRLFLDANIWISIYGPIACQDWRTTIYSKSLRQILSCKSLILLDLLVICEFINRFARFEYEQLKHEIKPPTFKKYRDSEEFKLVAQEIAVNVKKILKISTRCNFHFESAELGNLLSRFEEGNLDFNDTVILNLCESEDAVLITHDADFKNSNIPILTANKKMLQ